jgi:hypothetical protein
MDMTSNSCLNHLNDGVLCVEPSGDISADVISKTLSSSNNCSNINLVQDSDVNGDLCPVKHNYHLRSNTNVNSLINSSSASVRRPLSLDVADDFKTVSYKKNSKNGSKDVSVCANTNSSDADMDITVLSNFNDHRDINAGVIGGLNDNRMVLTSQQFTITDESTRYAQTRYPFSPFVLLFKSGKLSVNHIKDDLIKHCKMVHQVDIQVLNCRVLNAVCASNNYNVLIFVKDVLSYSCLLNKDHWPITLDGENYCLQSVPSIPPQLSVLVKNVDLNIDFDEFSDMIKDKYPQVKNVIRLKNKFQNHIKLVKLEFTCSIIREKMLNDRRILVNHISYEVVEYLAPANVLICSKCLAIGHFKKQCTQLKETCRTCGELVDNLKDHNCSQIEKCIHCQSNHKSNSLKCPVVKAFRAELTKKLLHLNNPTNPTVPAINVNVNAQSYAYKASNFPPPFTNVSTDNSMLKKFDELLNTMTEMKNQLTNLGLKYNSIEQLLLEKQKQDDLININLNEVAKNQLDLKKNVVHQGVFIDRHENMFCKLILPMFQDLFSFITSLNQDKKGNTLDADLKCKMERYLIQMKKAHEGNHITN